MLMKEERLELKGSLSSFGEEHDFTLPLATQLPSQLLKSLLFLLFGNKTTIWRKEEINCVKTDRVRWAFLVRKRSLESPHKLNRYRELLLITFSSGSGWFISRRSLVRKSFAQMFCKFVRSKSESGEVLLNSSAFTQINTTTCYTVNGI